MAEFKEGERLQKKYFEGEIFFYQKKKFFLIFFIKIYFFGKLSLQSMTTPLFRN